MFGYLLYFFFYGNIPDDGPELRDDVIEQGIIGWKIYYIFPFRNFRFSSLVSNRPWLSKLFDITV